MPGFSARTVVVRGSFALALIGWVASLAMWIMLGRVAGILPGFLLFLTMASTFSVTFCVTVVMPDKARMFGLGVMEGIRLERAVRNGDDPTPERHLRAL